MSESSEGSPLGAAVCVLGLVAFIALTLGIVALVVSTNSSSHDDDRRHYKPHHQTTKDPSSSQGKGVVFGTWDHWEDAGPCLVTCGRGYRLRVRKCEGGDGICKGPEIKEERCKARPSRCPKEEEGSGAGNYI